MTSNEGLLRLKTIGSTALQILQQIDTRPSLATLEAELRELAGELKRELQREYERTLPEGVQRRMTLFELTVYSPTIEEAWRETGISKLKVNSPINDRWQEIFEAIAYTTTKYVS